MATPSDKLKNAQDWVRLLRFSNDVNLSTVGVDTDRVTPLLMLASSNKLLSISKGLSLGDAKDSLRYQRFFGPVEYFALRIQKDGGSVARSMLWKATNKGNLDFIGSGSLQPHINAVFNLSNLSQFIDNTTPLDGIDNAMKVTRIGLGGLPDEEAAPIEMRLVQPSYYGYVDGVRTSEKSPGITGYLTKNVQKGTDGKLYQQMMNMRTGKLLLVDSQKAAASVVTTNLYLDSKDLYVYALGGLRGVRVVKRADIDYVLPHSDDAYSTMANNVPMLSGIKAMRLLMGCHHPLTPIIIMDEKGNTDIVPAKRVGHIEGTIYVFGCDELGRDAIYKVNNVVPRIPLKKSVFKKVVLQSGRVLTTSCLHKWYIRLNDKFVLKQAKLLELGMLVPRTLFLSAPVKRTTIKGKFITKEVCTLMGRLVKTLAPTQHGYKFTYIVNKLLNIDQKHDIETALKYLGVIKYTFFKTKTLYCVSIKDDVFLDWLDLNISLEVEKRHLPKCILSLPPGYTSAFLDSYFKDLQDIGEDCNGDNWILLISNGILRDGLAFMLSKICTDTLFRDGILNKKVHRALQLVPYKLLLGDIVLLKIVSISDVASPAIMIDIDCDDNVYAAGNGVITHNSKYGTQAVPLQTREAPLVRSLDTGSGKDMPTILGKMMGSQWALKPGVVKAVRKDRIDMVYDDGTKGSVHLYLNFPANAKGWISNYVKVKAGDKVSKGQLLATSNYTDEKGAAATGRNLRIGYMSYKGGTYEDGCILSLDAAKKMAYTVMYKTGMDKDKSIRTSKSLYNTWKPGYFTKLQLANLDDNGVAKVGTTLNPGDPVMLGIRLNAPSPGSLGKRILTDVTLVWDHHTPGIVTDVVNTKKGIRVYATVSKPMEVGDKLCYDLQTLILTDKGWKYFNQLTLDDKVYTLDYTSNKVVLQKPAYLHRYKYKGKMYSIKGLKIDLCVTPNHKNLISYDGLSFILLRADKHFGKEVYFYANLLISSKLCQLQWIDYKGHVYCCTVAKYHTLWVRRNNKKVWSGNSGYYGNKGTVAQVIPTLLMPKDLKGRPLDLLFDPLGIISRTNPSQLMLAGLGKVALKLGQPIVVPQFMPKGQSRLQYVKSMMKKHNVPWKLTVYDPTTNRHIKNVYTGTAYFMPLKHIGLTKMSARGTLAYTALGVPASGGYEGSKRIGSLLSAALAGHNAFDFLTKDAKLIRGQANADFWRSIRTGKIPVIPGEPLAHKKFFAHLQGSGLNIKRTDLGISIFSLTNSDVNLLAGNREVSSTDTYLQKNFRPIEGGLFGTDIFGMDGDKWGCIKLDYPLPNPVMLQPLARLLRMSDQLFEAVVKGKATVNGISNTTLMKAALAKLDLLKLAQQALVELKSSSPSKKDNAIKRYVAIGRMRDQGINPALYMLLKIPVLPSQFRPITSHGDLTMVADSNYLYAQLINARNDLREAKKAGLPLLYLKDAQANIYSKWKLLVGLYDPSDVKLRSKSVKGLLKWALGKSQKTSAFAQKVLGSTVDTVGRGVVVPSTKIKLNLIGMPILMAWGVFSPFITRKLVQQNYTPVEAMKMVKLRSPLALEALKEAVELRPVVLNRAPSLHKLSLMGFNVKLTNGSAIKVNPSIVVPFNMDFDGDTANLHVPVSQAGIRDVRLNMMPLKNLISMRKNKILYKPLKAYAQGLYVATRLGLSKDVKVFNSVALARLAYHKGAIDIDTPIVIK